MEQYKEIKTTTIVKNGMETQTTNKTLLHTIRKWEELTREEQEEEIQSRGEIIYQNYQEDLYYMYQEDLELLKSDIRNITFEDIYLDGNSQGAWIDKVKDFQYHCEGIDIYGEHLDVDDIDLHIRKYIYEIDENDINIYDYYIDSETLEKIKKTKKYKKWINNIIEEVNEWIQRANEICKELISNEYYCPYNLDDEEDKEWLDNYFCEEEFETIEEVNN